MKKKTERVRTNVRFSSHQDCDLFLPNCSVSHKFRRTILVTPPLNPFIVCFVQHGGYVVVEDAAKHPYWSPTWYVVSCQIRSTHQGLWFDNASFLQEVNS